MPAAQPCFHNGLPQERWVARTFFQALFDALAALLPRGICVLLCRPEMPLITTRTWLHQCLDPIALASKAVLLPKPHALFPWLPCTPVSVHSVIAQLLESVPQRWPVPHVALGRVLIAQAKFSQLRQLDQNDAALHHVVGSLN